MDTYCCLQLLFCTANGRQGRGFTLSMAIPGSIVQTAQSPELRSYLAGQVARAAVVFNVDEIVIFKENTSKNGDFTQGRLESALQTDG